MLSCILKHGKCKGKGIIQDTVTAAAATLKANVKSDLMGITVNLQGWSLSYTFSHKNQSLEGRESACFRLCLLLSSSSHACNKPRKLEWQ